MTHSATAVRQESRRWLGPVVDESKVQAHLRELRRELEKGAWSWILPRFLKVSIGGTLFLAGWSFLSGDLAAFTDTSSPLFFVRWLLPTLLGIPTVLGMYRRVRKRVDRGVGPIAEEIMREWERWSGKGWVRRTLATGAGITAAVGGGVGLLMSTLFPASELPGGSRILMFIAFVGLTSLWAVPAAFGVRALALRNQKPFLRLSAVGDGSEQRTAGL